MKLKLFKKSENKKTDLTKLLKFITERKTFWDTTIDFTPEELNNAIKEFREESMPGYLTKNLQNIFDIMLSKDPTLNGLIETRKLAITGKDYQFIPADDSKNAQEQAEFCKENLSKLFPNLLDELLTARLRGITVILKIFAIENHKIVLKDFKSYDRKLFSIKDDKVIYIDENADNRELPIDWYIAIFEKNPVMLPISIYYLYKYYALKNWTIYSEIYGQPLRVGKYKQGATKEDIEILKEMVFNLGTDAAAVVSENTLIEFIEAAQKTGSIAVYKELAEYCDKAKAIRVLGQAQTADLKGTVGSYASYNISNVIRNDILFSDAKWLETEIDKIDKQLCEINFSPPLIPSFDIITKPPVNLKEKIQIDKILWEDGMADFPEDYFNQTYNIPLPEKKKS